MSLNGNNDNDYDNDDLMNESAHTEHRAPVKPSWQLLSDDEFPDPRHPSSGHLKAAAGADRELAETNCALELSLRAMPSFSVTDPDAQMKQVSSHGWHLVSETTVSWRAKSSSSKSSPTTP